MTRRILLAATLLLMPTASWAQGWGSPVPYSGSDAALSGRMDELSGGLQGVMDDLSGGAEGAAAGAAAAASAMEGHDALTDLDRQLDHALDDPDPDVPPVPSGCLDRGADCEECFGAAYEQLARSRLLLLRTRALYDATHRFASAAQAHGDNLAPATREAAIVWEMQKPRIRASLGQFDAAYDRKIADMLAVVQRTLRELAVCEKRFYNTLDWYERYGFIYFEFLQARFTRT